MTPLSGRQIAMQRLLKAAKLSTAADIDRASLFLERAKEVRRGNRANRNEFRESQSQGAKRKAAKLDQPLTWE
jgi:hypothetical protein